MAEQQAFFGSEGQIPTDSKPSQQREMDPVLFASRITQSLMRLRDRHTPKSPWYQTLEEIQANVTPANSGIMEPITSQSIAYTAMTERSADLDELLDLTHPALNEYPSLTVTSRHDLLMSTIGADVPEATSDFHPAERTFAERISRNSQTTPLLTSLMTEAEAQLIPEDLLEAAPAPLQELEGVERRIDWRLDSSIRVQMLRISKDCVPLPQVIDELITHRSQTGEALDISFGGCAVTSATRWLPGERLILRMYACQPSMGYIDATATVVRTIELGYGLFKLVSRFQTPLSATQLERLNWMGTDSWTPYESSDQVWSPSGAEDLSSKWTQAFPEVMRHDDPFSTPTFY